MNTNSKNGQVERRKERRKDQLELNSIAATFPGLLYTFQRRPDGSTCFPYVSPTITDVCGLTPDQVAVDAGKVFAHIHPDDLPRILASIEESARSMQPWCEEFRYLHPDKGEIWLAGHSVPMPQDDGSILWQGYIQNTTERKCLEQVLQSSQEDLNRAQEVAHIGSWRLDVRHNELLWSDENHRIFGIPRGPHLTYETFLSVVHPDDREYVDREWQAALHGKPYDIEHRLLVDGEEIWVRERAELEFDEAGQLLGGFGTTQVVTDLKRAELALLDADRRKDEFLSMLAHELRNPLAPIRNAAQVLGHAGLDRSRLHWVRDTIERQVGHLVRLVDDLLDVSRIVQGKIALQRQPLDLKDLVERSLEATGPLCEKHRCQVRPRLAVEPLYVEADPVRLAQVVYNLLENACKYSPEGGDIELTLERSGNHAQLCVADQGIGIPPDLLPRVFDLFQQGQQSLDRPQGGLGIGLTLVQRLVQMHGGQVQAYSEGSGKGSQFLVRLPLSETKVENNAAPESGVATGQHLLIVDDDHAVADSTAFMLELAGYQVRAVYSGEAALAAVASFEPRVVLLDIGMKGMDGYQTARHLRALPGGDRLWLVALSGYGDRASMQRATEAGMDRYLVKPVDPKQLYSQLDELSRQQRSPPPTPPNDR